MSCTLLDKDQSFAVLDYGPGGIVAPVTLNLPHGLKPGAVISTVITTDHDMAINIRDAKKNILLHVVSRVTSNSFGLNSFLDDNKWGHEVYISPVPVVRNCRFVTMLIYEAAGYRVFINGAEVAFYKHRSSAAAHQVEINGGQTFKVVYLTMRDIIPA